MVACKTRPNALSYINVKSKMIGLIAVSFYLPCTCGVGRISELLEKLIEDYREIIQAKRCLHWVFLLVIKRYTVYNWKAMMYFLIFIFLLLLIKHRKMN